MPKISFKSDGFKLSGNLFIPNNSKSIGFLLIQGWAGHQNIKAAEMLTSHGYPTMTYDMRGNGESEGRLDDFSTSRADFIKDSELAYDFFKAKSKVKYFGVIGSSFGSYTAVLLSSRRKVLCLSLRVPALYPDEGFNNPILKRGHSEKRPLNYKNNKALMALHNFKGQIQIIEAEKDEMVPSITPKNYAEAIQDKNKLTYNLMKNAPHRLINDVLQLEYEKLLIDWIKNKVRM